jgi:ferrous iron transport protein B
LSKPVLKIALAGNPNSGKTSIFNQLTELNLKVGNFAGVTVEKVSGKIKYNNQTWELTDFPGTYSLFPKSEDEKVSTQAFINRDDAAHPNVVVFVADYSQLQRNLLLLTQLADLKLPIVFAINKADLGNVDAQEITSLAKQAETVLGIETVLVSARNKEGFNSLLEAIERAKPATKTFWQVPKELHNDILRKTQGQALTNLYTSYVGIMAKDGFVMAEQLQLNEVEDRQKTIEPLAKSLTQKVQHVKNREATKKIDNVLTHKVFGPLIFLCVLYLVFQSIFRLAEYPMEAIEAAFSWLSNTLSAALPKTMLSDLLTQGILPGIMGVVIFLPQILFLFFFLSLMEESGYMARVAFLSDKLMSKVGLNGKSVVPLLSGAACAIPAIMAARNIENRKDRLITILVTPLISCSARLPVYILLISLIVPEGDNGFIFNNQGLVLMAMYLVGIMFAILVAGIFKLILKNDKQSFFVMEMPDYQLPRWRNIVQILYVKGKSFVVQAGKIILLVSVGLWVLASFAPGDKFAEIDKKYQQEELIQGLSEQDIDNRISAEKLAASYAGEIGRFIEPAIRPLGYDWKIGIALVTSFAAREVFVGTMATIYSLGSDEGNLDTLKEKLLSETNPKTGKPVFSIAVAFSLMMFYAFALQCISTIAVMYKETQGIKWPLVQLLYLTIMAYLAGFLTYTMLS